jgi:hypothetical protein
MAGMEQVEAPVGQDYSQTVLFKLVNLEIGLVEGQDFLDPHEAILLAGTLASAALPAGQFLFTSWARTKLSFLILIHAGYAVHSAESSGCAT